MAHARFSPACGAAGGGGVVDIASSHSAIVFKVAHSCCHCIQRSAFFDTADLQTSSSSSSSSNNHLQHKDLQDCNDVIFCLVHGLGCLLGHGLRLSKDMACGFRRSVITCKETTDIRLTWQSSKHLKTSNALRAS